MKQGSIV